jgi:hypothetical protein
MPGNPLDDLCDAVRSLPPAKAGHEFNKLLLAKAINFNDAVEYGRALSTLRALVTKREAWAKKRHPSN